ncbi:hypothetical protein KUC3_39800 [Alteromonas sp. KC3]|uniref:hypothetical protein n=1 Tax=unclassified Alteromonas TaxID=2614992 RepID=UPI001923711D|nr:MULTISPECIES: hypothetical protein [unclassified Alteromonas]BCO21123.1 hypothetical protein KUC3_39800 [Alteromonas sp. KC3]BCO25088.1 hypothetical protein KUC14_39570 [Alteromonas sp. KC14]
MTVKKIRNIDIVEFKKRPCVRHNLDEFYQPPSSKDLRDLISIMHWNYADVAKLVGVSLTSKGSSATVQRWCSPESSGDYRKIPFSAWRLLLAYADIIAVSSRQAQELL